MTNVNKKHIIVGVIIALLVGGGIGFYAGKASVQGKGRMTAGSFSAGGRTMPGGQTTGNFRARANGSLTAGSILSKDDKSITIKLQDGGSRIALLSSSTTISKSITGTSNDLNVGGNVVVTGSANADGSVNAQTIQLRDDSMMKQMGQMGPMRY